MAYNNRVNAAKKVIVLIVAAAATAGFFFYPNKTEEFGRQLEQTVKYSEQALDKIVAPAVPEHLVPPPLRVPILRPSQSDNLPALAQNEVVKWTNIQRANNGLPALKDNAKLDQAAARKVQDMFARQYFEHVSPSGEGPSDLAGAAGYKYILVGENLALGDFKDAQALAEAWMNSPGHRANILHERFQEIGAAVARGKFQGETVWLAVQEFGTPLSSCPQLDPELQSQISANNAEIKLLRQQLENSKQKLDEYRGRDNQAYNEEVNRYNDLVSRYNNLIDKTKALVNEYNAQVNAFNQCVKE